MNPDAAIDAPPPVLVINLDRDTARMAHMRRELEAAGLAFQRFPAAPGDDLPEAVRAYFPPDSTLSRGELGCYASHLRICQLVVSGALPAPLLVLEDDLSFPPGFAALLQRTLRALPKDWDMARLSNVSKHAMIEVAALDAAHSLVRYSRVPGSTGASLLSRRGAEKFLKRTERRLPVDQDLRRVWAWDFDVYGVHPMPLRRDVFDDSSIDSMAAPGLRKDQRRLARMRRARLQEAPQRFAHGMRAFGWRIWAQLEAANLLASLTPKRKRKLLLRRTDRRTFMTKA